MNTQVDTMSAEAGAPEGVDLLYIIGQAMNLSKDYQSRTIEKPLGRSYRAWQNQHADGSKYLGTAWKGRSRLFVPKTRSAVRKNLATAAAALFSTQDVVNVSAEMEDDPRQRATAAVMKADLEHRLTRGGVKSGIPWYQIALGACHDGQLTGICVSKQFWDYEEVPDGTTRTEQVHNTNEEGEPLYDEVENPLTGEPEFVPNMVEGQVPNMRVTRDRPMIEMIPIENIGVDPAAPWYSPVQLGRWFYVRYPMGLGDVKAMMASNGKGGFDRGWLNVPDAVLLKGRVDDDRTSARRTREGGTDRYEDGKSTGDDLDIVWIQENFLRVAGVDYHWWSVGRHAYISKVRRTHESYPQLDGERPYVFGVAQLDPHRVFPMSPVESWQPLQLEINDITNLRQDSLKRSIAPIALAKRGKNVDFEALRRRGQPETVVMVDNTDDVVFTSTPGPTGASYTETSTNNAMFDELAGVFSTSSVQSNRQLNETVGGMRLMSGAANAVSEFDLRMWTETWVEPVLRQVMHLLRKLESDGRILAIAGQKARVWKEFKYIPGLDDFEQTEVTLTVNAGTGAMDPMQKIAKLKMALEMMAPMFKPMLESGVKPRFDQIVREIMGNAGFKDGERFFEFGDPPPQQPDPETEKLKAEVMLKSKELDIEREDIASKFKAVLLELRAETMNNQLDNQTKIKVEEMKGRNAIAKQTIGAVVDQHSAKQQRAHETAQTREGRAYEADQADKSRSHAEKLASAKAAAQGNKGGDKKPAPEPKKDPGAERRQRVIDILSGKKPEASAQPSGQAGTAMVPRQPMQPAPQAQRQPDPSMLIMAKMVEQLQSMSQTNSAIVQALHAIGQQNGAPSEVVRDPATGQAIGVRKGGRFQQIMRGPDNRIVGAGAVA
jgi:hypothetical protein